MTESQRIRQSIRDKFDYFIGHLHQAPAYVVDNEFIKTGYRINFNSTKQVLKSLFMRHNETVNVWSHLLGAIVMVIFISMLGVTVASNFNGVRSIDQIEKKVSLFLEPLYNKFSNFTDLDYQIRTQLELTKKDYPRFKEEAIDAIKLKTMAILNEFEMLNEEIAKEKALVILNSLEEKLKKINDLYDEVYSSITGFELKNNLQQISQMGNQLKQSLVKFQDNLTHKITSSEYEWIDIYTYFDQHHITSSHQRQDSDPRKLSRWPILVFLISAIFCLLSSSIFHLFYCLGYRANQILLRLDYAGVCILIYGSCFPPCVYGFYCQPFYYNFWLTVNGIATAVVFTLSMMDFMHTEKYRKIKSMMYGGLGIFVAFPIVHLAINSMKSGPDNDYLAFMSSVPFYAAMGASYLGGLTIFFYRCPERYKPGQFDTCGHSHNLWHTFVVMGILLHYLGCFENYYTRVDTPCIM